MNVVIVLVSLAVVVVTIGVMWRLGTWPFAAREPFGGGEPAIGAVPEGELVEEAYELKVMREVIALITKASNLTNEVEIGRGNRTLTTALVTALGAAKASSEFAAL